MSRGSTEGRSDSFRPVMGATVLLFLAVLAVAGVRSWRDLERARQREHSLESQITETEAQIARLRNRIERLRSDPGTLERRAREDLGMVRPGDVVIELPASPPGPLSHLPTTPRRERGNASRATRQVTSPAPPPPIQPAPLPASPQAAEPQPVTPAGGPPASSAPAS